MLRSRAAAIQRVEGRPGSESNRERASDSSCISVHYLRGPKTLLNSRALRNINGPNAETNNLGRDLIEVQWHGSFQMYVFPDETKLIDSALERDRTAAVWF